MSLFDFKSVLPYVHSVQLSLVHLWPEGNFKLQLKFFACILCLVFERLAVVLIPNVFGNITHYLNSDHPEFNTAWKLVLLFSLAKAADGFTARGGILASLQGILWLDIQQSFKKRLKVHMYTRLHSMSVKWHMDRKLGETLGVVDRGIHGLEDLVSTLTFQLIPTLSDVAVAAFYYNFLFDTKLSSIVLVTTITYFAMSVKFAGGRIKQRQKLNRSLDSIQAEYADVLYNYETVKYFAAETHEIARYQQNLEKYQIQEKSVLRTSFISASLMDSLMGVGFTCGSIYCISLITNEMTSQLNPDQFVVFAAHMSNIFIKLSWLGCDIISLTETFSDIEGFKTILEIENELEIKETPNAPNVLVEQGYIEFRDVSFKYRDSDNWALRKLNFSAKPGQTLAIVGPSGSGKTTLFKLLYRLYDIQEGKILIDNQKISTVSKKSLRKSFGLIPQDTVLFNETIAYNIRYGTFSASAEDIESAAKMAQIHDKIKSMDHGYESKVGDRGCQLSGGERQRLAIARALVMKPKIMLLDEATASLDAKTEMAVNDTLKQVCSDKTTLVIAHRLQSVMHANRILVLQHGEIVEDGNHSKLLMLGGLYAEMWKKQNVS